MSNPNDIKSNMQLQEIEDREWRESLDYVLQEHGPERMKEILRQLQIRAQE